VPKLASREDPDFKRTSAATLKSCQVAVLALVSKWNGMYA